MPNSNQYQQLQPEDRMTIASMQQQRLSVRAMTRALSRSPSTITRELARNTPAQRPYGSHTAQQAYSARRVANNRTDTDGRILFETSLDRVHGGGHVARYLAARIKREFMGGAYPYFLPKSSCWDGRCFDEPIENIAPELFQKVLAAYNTHWIIAHSPELKQLAESTPSIRKVSQFNGITIYALNNATTFVMHGAGRVAGRTFNRIDIEGASGPEITLRYRWVPGIKTEPPSSIEPFPWSVDFPPFIRIISPSRKFSLQLER